MTKHAAELFPSSIYSTEGIEPSINHATGYDAPREWRTEVFHVPSVQCVWPLPPRRLSCTLQYRYILASTERFELPTLELEVPCSVQLSYAEMCLALDHRLLVGLAVGYFQQYRFMFSAALPPFPFRTPSHQFLGFCVQVPLVQCM